MRPRNWLLRTTSLLGLVAIWWITALIADSFVLPTPQKVLISFWSHTLSGELPYHLAATLGRVAVSFLLAMSIGVAIGIVMGRYRRLDIALDGALVLGLNIPALVTIVLCYIWFWLDRCGGGAGGGTEQDSHRGRHRARGRTRRGYTPAGRGESVSPVAIKYAAAGLLTTAISLSDGGCAWGLGLDLEDRAGG